MRLTLLTLTLLPVIAFGQETIVPPDVTMNSVPLVVTPPTRINPPLDVHSESAFVYDLTANEVVYMKNSDQERPIASITKMMTAYLVLSQDKDLDEVITLSNSDMELSHKGSGGSKLHAGMRFTRERLLNLALMSSENRAAAALGRTTFGNVPEFVDHMNQMAHELGMNHTHFVDPIGIGEGNTSTAEDLVKLIAAASEDDLIREFSTTKWKEVVLPTQRRHKHPTHYRNTDALVGFRDWNILVQKTGFTNAAGHCVVMIVEIDGHQYAVIELDSPNNIDRAFDAIKLRYWVQDGEELSNDDIKPLSPYPAIYLKRKFSIHHVHHHHHHRHKP